MIFVVLIFMVVVFMGRIYAIDKIQKENHFKYFLPALIIKMLSSLSFCIIYMTAYGGDTLSYFHNMQVMRNLFFESPLQYFEILIKGIDSTSFYYFNNTTGMPSYMWKDSSSFFVSRLLSPIAIISGNSFLVSSLIVSVISFLGLWQLYTLLIKKFPSLRFRMAIACLFMPSVLFWGSGIMKDTIVIFCMCIVIVVFEQLMKLKFNLLRFLWFLICAWGIIIIKPYIIVALLPTLFVWLFYNQYLKMKKGFIKSAMIPVFLVLIFGGVLFTFSRLSSSMGHFGSIDTMVDRAKIIQEDLIREEQYGSNFFYIGEISGETSQLVKLFPNAVLAGLFRPYLWEVKNFFMLLSGLENFAILLMTLIVFFRRKAFAAFRIIGNDPFLLGIMIFVIFLAFGIGLSTSNFGALVRYRIPLMPLFVAGLFIIEKKLSRSKRYRKYIISQRVVLQV